MRSIKPPQYFYTLHDTRRWVDPYADPQGQERRVLTPAELKDRYLRNTAYRDWLSRYRFRGQRIRGKQMKWQAVQVMCRAHSENHPSDWWGPYVDCVFRVFLQPETRRCRTTGDWKQWYVLCPEDAEMVNRFEASVVGSEPPPRNALSGERFISTNPNLRKARIIPTECCRQWRHETTAGKVDALL